MVKVRIRVMGMIRIRVTVAVIHDTFVKKYWYRYWQYFSQVLLTTLFLMYFDISFSVDLTQVDSMLYSIWHINSAVRGRYY